MSDVNSNDAHPEAGAIQGGEAASDSSGMTPDDAASSAYDDWDRGHNEIAEGERENVGQFLKSHADSAGVPVIGGLNSLIEPAVTLRHGDMTAKREVIGSLIDEYGVHPIPEAEAAPVPAEYGEPALGAEGQPVATGEQAVEAIEQFAQANPIARDQRIQDHMTFIAHDYEAARFPANPRSGLSARRQRRSSILATGAPSTRGARGRTGEGGKRPGVGRGSFGAVEPGRFR